MVGIDDWAWKKGQRYGTIITDLERPCPIALLEDREAETVAAWLKDHSTIRSIARDRAGAYADGGAKGAPQAIQVYDAVRAGAEQKWSTGPVEGAINTRKMVKRTMFGHAGFPLLQRRVLLAG